MTAATPGKGAADAGRPAWPTGPGSLLAVCAAAVTVGLVATGVDQRLALSIVLAGVVAGGVGARGYRRGRRVGGLALTLAGGAAVAGGVALGVVRTGGVAARAELLAGLVGVGLLGAGLAPVRVGRERTLVTAGAGALVVGTCLAGLVGASVPSLLGATTAAVVAWDAGERAVSLGEQVGPTAPTLTVELGRTAATSLYGAAVVGAGLLVRDAGVTDVPLAGLVLLLGAALALTIALYN